MNRQQISILVSVVLIFVAGCGTPNDATPTVETDPFRLASDVRPLEQQLRFDIDPEKSDYGGSTTITIDVARESPELLLHARDLQIEVLQLSRDGNPIPVTYSEGEGDLLHISGERPLTPGQYVLQIEFSNNFSNDGFGIYRTEQGGRHYIFSQFEAMDARQAFPAFDEPGFKIPWQVTMTVPENVLPITNTPEVAVEQHGDTRTVVFAKSPPLPSYLVAIIAGEFDTVPIEGMSVPGRVVTFKGKADLAAFAVTTTPSLLAELEDYFAAPYPFRKLDLIATKQAFGGAMEHPGAITYSDYMLLLDKGASFEQKKQLIEVTAHELAHQWFGNLVTMQWWNDLWLNEAFADWMGRKVTDAAYPEYSTTLDGLRTALRVMEVDAQESSKPIRRDYKAMDNIFADVFLSYFKGKTVLGMFEQAVGESAFRQGVVNYIRKYSYKNARAEDLWAEIATSADFDVVAGLSSFINQPGVPLVSVSTIDSGRYEIRQSRIFSSIDAPQSDQTWVIPVTYKYRSGNRIQSGGFILDSMSQELVLGEEAEWLLPNAGQNGYYRWRIPDDMVTRLFADAAQRLSVPERMAMLSNLWALLSAGEMDAGVYLGAIRNVAEDEDSNVLDAMIDQLDNVREVFVTPELRPLFASYLRETLNPLLDRIGTRPIDGEPGDISSLRIRLLVWLSSFADDSRANNIVASAAQAYLDGEAEVNSNLSQLLEAAARRGDTELFEAFKARFEAAQTPSERIALAGVLGNFRDAGLAIRALDYGLAADLRPNEILRLMSRTIDWPDNNDITFDWLRRHDAELRERIPAEFVAFLPGALMLCSGKNIDAVSEFYGAPERAVPGIDDEIAEESVEHRECAAFRQRELESVRRYLANN